MWRALARTAMSDLSNLQSLFAARTFRIPEYQRGYSWLRE
jgi:uncharacterized protein with ParB-like and HNH nuclease domain